MTCENERTAAMKQMMAAPTCFTYTEVDYFGPLNVKRGRSVQKMGSNIYLHEF